MEILSYFKVGILTKGNKLGEAALENENNRIQKSKAYRLGKLILKPISFVRHNILKK